MAFVCFPLMFIPLPWISRYSVFDIRFVCLLSVSHFDSWSRTFCVLFVILTKFYVEISPVRWLVEIAKSCSSTLSAWLLGSSVCKLFLIFSSGFCIHWFLRKTCAREEILFCWPCLLLHLWSFRLSLTEHISLLLLAWLWFFSLRIFGFCVFLLFLITYWLCFAWSLRMISSTFFNHCGLSSLHPLSCFYSWLFHGWLNLFALSSFDDVHLDMRLRF